MYEYTLTKEQFDKLSPLTELILVFHQKQEDGSYKVKCGNNGKKLVEHIIKGHPSL